jgi:DNA-binding transcriptional regulator YiaG
MELLADLEAELAELKSRIKGGDRFSARAVKEDRQRLELSAKDYGQLVGVSHLTIYNWEHGRSRPRTKQMDAWLAIKGVGKREAWKRLGY